MADSQDPKTMEPYQRLIAAAWMGTTDPQTRQRLKKEALDVLTVENLAVLALVLGVYALGTAVTAPWSLIVNAALATVGAVAFGATILKTAPALANYARTAWYAQTEADLQRAARFFSDGLVAVGPDLIIAVLGASSFALVRRVILARIRLPRLRGAPKTEPAAPRTEPTAPRSEPGAPKSEPRKPLSEPTVPKSEPGKPSLTTRVGGVALDVAAGNALGQGATKIKAWHVLLPLGVVGAVTVGALAIRSAGRGGGR